MNVKNIVLGFGIVVVFALLLWQGIEAFTQSPEYSDYCSYGRTTGLIDTQDRCEAEGGKWMFYDTKVLDSESTGYCNIDFYCAQEYEQSRKGHSQTVFFISLVIGILAIIAGYAVLSVEPVGSALIGSGIWAFFYGTAVNWANLGTIWRFLLLLAVFAMLIWIALRINRRVSKSSKKRKR